MCWTKYCFCDLQYQALIFLTKWTDIDGNIISLGDSLLLNSNNYTIGNPEIQLTVLNECGEETTSEDLVIEKCDIPNVITPNGDNVNDYFYTHFASIYDDVNLII